MDSITILTTFTIVALILVMILVESFFVKRGGLDEQLRTTHTKLEGLGQAIVEHLVRHAIIAGLRSLFPNHKGFQALYCYSKQVCRSVTSETRLERLMSIAERNIYREESNKVICRPVPIVEICLDIAGDYALERLTDFYGKSNVKVFKLPSKMKGDYTEHISYSYATQKFEANFNKLKQTKDGLSEEEIAALESSADRCVESLKATRERFKELSFVRYSNPVAREKVNWFSGILSSLRPDSRKPRQDIIS